jgi:hypothetical protein
LPVPHPNASKSEVVTKKIEERHRSLAFPRHEVVASRSIVPSNLVALIKQQVNSISACQLCHEINESPIDSAQRKLPIALVRCE